MEGAEHEVAGEGGADGHFSGFKVANFADHNDIGVLAEDMAERGSEGEADFGADLDLIDAGHFVLDGVFDGDDAIFDRVDFVKEGVKRSGFSGAGRSGDQENAVGTAYHFFHEGLVLGVESQFGQSDMAFAADEKAEGDAFAVDGGHGRDADINFLAPDSEADAAVLGESFFRDIHIGHYFDPGDDGGLEPGEAWGEGCGMEDAVDPVADAEFIFHGFEVDIGCPFLVSFPDNLVDELDDGGFLIVLVEIGFEAGLLGFGFDAVILDELLDCFGADAVAFSGGTGDFGGGGESEPDAESGGEAEGIEEAGLERVGDGDEEDAVFDGERENVMLEDGFGREFFENVRFDGRRIDFTEGQAEDTAEGSQEIRFGDSGFHEGSRDDALAGFAASAERGLDLFRGEQTGTGQYVFEAVQRRHHRVIIRTGVSGFNVFRSGISEVPRGFRGGSADQDEGTAAGPDNAALVIDHMAFIAPVVVIGGCQVKGIALEMEAGSGVRTEGQIAHPEVSVQHGFSPIGDDEPDMARFGAERGTTPGNEIGRKGCSNTSECCLYIAIVNQEDCLAMGVLGATFQIDGSGGATDCRIVAQCAADISRGVEGHIPEIALSLEDYGDSPAPTDLKTPI